MMNLKSYHLNHMVNNPFCGDYFKNSILKMLRINSWWFLIILIRCYNNGLLYNDFMINWRLI